MRANEVNHSYTDGIKDRVLKLGADLVGVANIEPLKQLKLNPPDLLDPYNRAISIAVKLPGAVMEQIIDRPTPAYASAYQNANRILDRIAIRTAGNLEKDGFKSLPIPASQILDWDNWYGAISHRAVGRMAGLGWLGKSLLLVNPQYGPRIRLVTVLTEAWLAADNPIANRCEKCTKCQDACPAEAIKGVGTKDIYKTRNEALFLARCADKLNGEFAKLPDVGVSVCGICIKVCPYSREKHNALAA